MSDFPKRADIYVHGSDDSMWELATTLGFKEGTDEHGMACHAADEFKITLEFDATGLATVVAVNGKAVQHE
jgi:hypothetical protein